MKVILDIKDNKSDFILELLKNFSYVKVKAISPAKAQLTAEIKEAVDNLKLVKSGKMKAKTLDELLDEI